MPHPRQLPSRQVLPSQSPARPQPRGDAIAHKILIAAYHVLSTGADYRDLGDGYLVHLDKTKVANQLVRRLNRLGYEVTLTENDTAA